VAGSPNSLVSAVAHRARPYAVVLALAALTALAAGLRFWHVTQLPPGYWYDEAHKSIVALAISRGQRFPIYVTDFQGIEAGYFWLLAAWFRVFGPSFFGTRYLAATIGTATVPITYWAVITVYRDHAQRRLIGLAAALWLAFLLWHLHWSRMGFELITVPLFSVGLLGLMAWACRRQSARAFAAAGVVLGLSLYTNPAARALPLQALVTFGLLSSGPWRQRLRLGLVFLFASAIVFAPLGLFFLLNPQWFVARAAFASAVTRAGGLPAYLDNALKTLLSLNFVGDAMPQHNLAGRPALDPISSAWMLVGLASLFVRRPGAAPAAPWRAHAAVLAALLINLVPSVLSDGAPEFGRTLGAAPLLVILPALGVAFAAARWRSSTARALLALSVVAAAGWNLYDYFYRYPRQPGLFDAFEVGQWTLIQGALQGSRAGAGYLMLDLPSLNHPTTQLARQLAGGDLRVLNGQLCLAYPAITSQPVVLAALESRRLELVKQLPGAQVQFVLHEPTVYPYGALLALPAGYAAPAATETSVATLGGAIDVLPVALPPAALAAGDDLHLTLRWRVAAPLNGRYNYFLHLVAGNQPLVAGVDGEPCGGWYPTPGWHLGEVIEQDVDLKLPASLAPGQYQLATGLYDWQTGARLPVSQPNQRETDRAFVGAVEVK